MSSPACLWSKVERRTALTDTSGSCVLPPGSVLTVSVTAVGFSPHYVDLSVGPVDARVTMHIQSQVNVDVKSTELVSPASVQGSITAEEADRVPVWLRKLENIQPLFPGIVPRSTEDEWGKDSLLQEVAAR